MFIANPLYDVVFRYMLEDLEVAKLFLGTLLEKEIIDLEFLHTEVTVNLTEEKHAKAKSSRKKVSTSLKTDILEQKTLTVLRLDFAATVKDKSGKPMQIIIELQKARLLGNMERFRNYLGKQYLNTNLYHNLPAPPPITRAGIPIYPIYILGYTLSPEYEKIPVIVVENKVLDRFSRSEIKKDDPFITSLFHEGMIIQITELKKQRRDRVEKLLSIFDNADVFDKFVLNFAEGSYPAEFGLLISRLVQAAANEKIRETMQTEDTILREFALWQEELEKRDSAVKAANKEAKQAHKRAEKAEQKAEAERKQKEIERKQKEAAENEKLRILKNSVFAMRNAGFANTDIARLLNIDENDVKKISED